MLRCAAQGECDTATARAGDPGGVWQKGGEIVVPFLCMRVDAGYLRCEMSDLSEKSLGAPPRAHRIVNVDVMVLRVYRLFYERLVDRHIVHYDEIIRLQYCELPRLDSSVSALARLDRVCLTASYTSKQKLACRRRISMVPIRIFVTLEVESR